MSARRRTMCAWGAVLGGAMLLAGSFAPPGSAQEPALSEAVITPIGDTVGGWLSDGAESPDGRFFLLSSYADDAMWRYDRETPAWGHLDGAVLGGQPRWSPDGRFVAYDRAAPDLRGQYIWIVPMDPATGSPSGHPRRITSIPGRWPAWSPDSRRIAFVNHEAGMARLFTVPFNGGDAELVFETRGGGGFTGWSPDGRYVFSGFVSPAEGERWVRVDVTTGRAETFPGPARRLIGYSPDGSMVAHRHHESPLLFISSAETGRVLHRLRLPRWVQPLGWSRSEHGRITAVEHVVSSHLLRVPFDGGEIESLSEPTPRVISEVHYSPDGERVALLRDEGSLLRIHVATADGRDLRPLGEPGMIGQLRWSPDGPHLAWETLGPESSVRVLEVASGQERTLVAPAHDVRLEESVAWRSDGQAVRYVRRSGVGNEARREAREVTLLAEDRLLARLPSMEGQPDFVHDTLALLQRGNGIDAIRLSDGSTSTLFSGPIRDRGGFGRSKDGEWIAFTAWEGEVAVPTLLSLQTGDTRRIPYGLGGETANVDFHPNGRDLVVYACLTCNGGVEKWDVVVLPMDGGPARILTASLPGYADLGFPTISPDGRTVMFEGERSYATRIVTIDVPGGR